MSHIRLYIALFFLTSYCIAIFNPHTHFLDIPQLLEKYLAKIDKYAKILTLQSNKLLVNFSKPVNKKEISSLIVFSNPFVNYQSKASLMQKPKFSKFIAENYNTYFFYPHRIQYFIYDLSCKL